MPERLSQREFVALMAMLFATVALAVDAMLPALPRIAAELSPDAPNLAQLVVTSYILGMGLGTLVSGPISDAFGRKAVLIGCATIYAVAAFLCFVAPTLETLLFARVLQGIGAAGPRAVGTALVRDLYKGRDMARIISFVMMIFALVPAVAPLIGQGVMLVGTWRDVFLVFIAFSALTNLRFFLRQAETLPPEQRRPLRIALLWDAAKELVHHRIARISTISQMLTQACLFAMLSSMQGVFDRFFGIAEWFPLLFTLIAVLSISGSFINTRVVVQAGMRRVVQVTYTLQVGTTALVIGLYLLGLPWGVFLGLFALWCVGIFAMMGLTMGNLNALAMEDLGHIAGFASSVITAASTMGSVVLAVPVGQAFDGTPLPLLLGVLAFSGLALALVSRIAPRPAT